MLKTTVLPPRRRQFGAAGDGLAVKSLSDEAITQRRKTVGMRVLPLPLRALTPARLHAFGRHDFPRVWVDKRIISYKLGLRGHRHVR